jgi:hypothetical protein
MANNIQQYEREQLVEMYELTTCSGPSFHVRDECKLLRAGCIGCWNTFRMGQKMEAALERVARDVPMPSS